MTRHTTLHPEWCGQGHVCSYDRPGGEHRSHPVTIDTPAGRIVATRVQTTDGRHRLEIRTVIDLAGTPTTRNELARLVVACVHRALVYARRTGGRS